MAQFAGPAPQQKIEGADQVLQSTLVVCDSGNVCIVTPGMKKRGEERRVVFFQAWKTSPTDADTQELYALLESMAGHKPMNLGSAFSTDEATAIARQFFESDPVK